MQALVAARGIGLDRVACDPWAIHACPKEWLGQRLMQVGAGCCASASVKRAVALCSVVHAVLDDVQLGLFKMLLRCANIQVRCV